MFMIDIIDVQPLHARHLELTFADGLHGVVNVDQVIGQYTGVFSALLDDSYFHQVTLNHDLGTVVAGQTAQIFVLMCFIRMSLESRSQCMEFACSIDGKSSISQPLRLGVA